MRISSLEGTGIGSWKAWRPPETLVFEVKRKTVWDDMLSDIEGKVEVIWIFGYLSVRPGLQDQGQFGFDNPLITPFQSNWIGNMIPMI